MGKFRVYGRRLAEWLFFWAIGHGIILFLATRGIYPDKFVASMITKAIEAPIWADWIISGAFGLLITFILEVFFWNRREASTARPIADVAASDLIGSPLQIEFESNNKYERTEHIDETGIFRRLIYVSVLNESVDDISDCNIRLITASPRPQTGDNLTNFPVFFGANFDLRGKQRKFIQIARFAENPGNGSTLERDNIIISAASGWLFPGWTTIPIPPENSHAIFTLEAFAPNIASRTAHLHIWVIQRRIHAQII
jgi:hypothetical protein